MKKLLGIVVKFPNALNQAPRNQRRDIGLSAAQIKLAFCPTMQKVLV